MTLLFRPHRELLADAMAEVVEVDSRAALLAHLQRDDFFAPQRIVSITQYWQGFSSIDVRTGWHTHIVMAEYPDGTIQPAGFTNGPLP